MNSNKKNTKIPNSKVPFRNVNAVRSIVKYNSASKVLNKLVGDEGYAQRALQIHALSLMVSSMVMKHLYKKVPSAFQRMQGPHRLDINIAIMKKFLFSMIPFSIPFVHKKCILDSFITYNKMIHSQKVFAGIDLGLRTVEMKQDLIELQRFAQIFVNFIFSKMKAHEQGKGDHPLLLINEQLTNPSSEFNRTNKSLGPLHIVRVFALMYTFLASLVYILIRVIEMGGTSSYEYYIALYTTCAIFKALTSHLKLKQ